MDTITLAQQTEIQAHLDIGQRETDGPNNSPRIREYLALEGLQPPQPYCASACSCWIFEAAKALGVTKTFKGAGSALHLWSNNPTLQIQPGDLVPGDLPVVGINQHADHIHGHAFLVIGIDDSTGQLQTIDPNSNPAGGSEGTGVWLLNVRNLSDSERLGYLRIQ